MSSAPHLSPESIAYTEPAVRREVAGRAVNAGARRLCIFAHHDPDNVVDDYVRFYLAELARLAEVVFVTACRELSQPSLDAITPLCSRIIFRENVGRDFGGFRVGLVRAGALDGRDEVVLANDSVYGPLRDLGALFARMDRADPDVWGITDSEQGGYHLQSYFLVFRRRLLAAPLFSAFWSQVRFDAERDQVILEYEIGLTRRLIAAGFRTAAACEFRKVRAFVLRHWPLHPHREAIDHAEVNQTHYCWRAAVGQFGCPFLKIDLLRDNGQRIRDLWGWQEFLKRHTTYPPDRIDAHLRRIWGHGPRPAGGARSARPLVRLHDLPRPCR
ncbi:MAG: hypothetical protein IT429_21525 [Gemmataceae bacterium]|nr:hypothetical protein [Gemmataceae bacterium]